MLLKVGLPYMGALLFSVGLCVGSYVGITSGSRYPPILLIDPPTLLLYPSRSNKVSSLIIQHFTRKSRYLQMLEINYSQLPKFQSKSTCNPKDYGALVILPLYKSSKSLHVHHSLCSVQFGSFSN